MICTIFNCRVTVTIYDIWCVDDFCDFQLYRDTDVLWNLMCWWFLWFSTVQRHWCFMTYDVLMIFVIFNCTETLTFYETWCVDDFCDFQLYRDTDVLWHMMCWWFLWFSTVERQWHFMKYDVLTIFTVLDCRETVTFYEIWCVDKFYYFRL